MVSFCVITHFYSKKHMTIARFGVLLAVGYIGAENKGTVEQMDRKKASVERND